MALSKLIQRLSKKVKKNDTAKGFLIGSATVLGTEGAVYISRKVFKKLNDKEKDNK